MVTLQLLHLPNEFLVIIISNTPARSILTGWALCRRLRALIKQTMPLQMRIWNMKHGIQELSPSGLSIPDFETYVRQWEKDCLNFTVEMQEATRLMYRSTEGSLIRKPRCPTECNYLLRSGYLIEMHQEENPGWSHIHLSLLRERRGLIKDPVWTDVRLGEHLTMGGWALDLDLDLVAASLLSPLGGLEIRLIHFSTGECHKSAKIPVIQLGFKGKYDRLFGTHIEIMGNYLVILLAHDGAIQKYQTLYLVDWIKGHVIQQQRSSAKRYFPVLTSISEDTFVLGLRSDWALALCRITKEGDASTFCTLCKLKLPDVWRKTHVELKNFNRAPYSPSVPKRDSTLPFRNSPSESVLSFYVVAGRWGNLDCFPTILFFYVHPSSLRALAERARAVAAEVSGMGGFCRRLARGTTLSPKTLPITVVWKNWGPEMTRWIQHKDPYTRQSLSGTRCAVSNSAGKEVQVLDFNPARGVRILEHLAEKKDHEWEKLRELLVNSPSTIPAGKNFKHDIVSHLPYFDIRREEPKGELLMDDQWVVQARLDISDQWYLDPIARGSEFWIHSVEERPKKFR